MFILLNLVQLFFMSKASTSDPAVYLTQYQTSNCSYSICSVCRQKTQKGRGVISICSEECWKNYKDQFRQWGLDPEFTHFWLRGELWGHERDIAKNADGELCIVAWIPIKRDRVFITLKEMKSARQTEN
jgi:hypothetical protein